MQGPLSKVISVHVYLFTYLEEKFANIKLLTKIYGPNFDRLHHIVL